MFWKSNKIQEKGKGISSWSITTQLVVLYTLSAAVILSLTTGFLYWILENNIENADQRFLNDKIEVLKSISDETHPGFERLKEEVQWEVEAYQFNRYYARVLSSDGEILIETPNMLSILPVSIFSRTNDGMQSAGDTREWKSADGQQYILMSDQVAPSRGGNGPRFVQVALNVSSQQQILAEYFHALLVVLGIAILFSAAAGAFVARKGMKPLAEITKTVKLISASKLQKRTQPDRWPSELTTLARAFDEMLDRLESSFKRLRQFSADLAHELRTPINNLMGETEVALSKTRSAEEYREVLESNLEEYNRLSMLIKNLLFLAETDNNRRKLSKTVLSGLNVLEDIAEFYDMLAAERNIRIQLHGQVDISADPSLFRRAISNILSNAIQYAPNDSTINITMFRNNGRTHIKITDQGPGIPTEHIPKLFDRFYRVDNSRSTKLGGTGLGLSIVKSIMDLHGGEITISSQTKEGTTVQLIFPAL